MKRWRAKEGETYYYVTTCLNASWGIEDGGDLAKRRYKIGNYFEDYFDAEFVASCIRETVSGIIDRWERIKEGGKQ